MSDTTYPDVPIAPGVPPVPQQPGSITAEAVPMTEDTYDSIAFVDVWGIFTQDGEAALTADSVLGIEIRKEFRISDFQTEEGGFSSYNKIETPLDAIVQFAISGSDEARAQFLTEVAEAVASLELYTVVTREFSYPSANLVNYGYRRTAQSGVTLLQVDVGVREVRVSATSTFSNTRSPSGADPVNLGTVRPQTPTPAQSSAVSRQVGPDAPSSTIFA